jgi:hypothetical protein
MTINYCHIAPTPHLKELTATNGSHLLLAHLIENDRTYREFYANLNDGKQKIMDNGAFELFKQGKPMYSADKLIEMATSVNADIIVAPDYPMQDPIVTINAAIEWIPRFKEAGFGTFFVPQSTVGDIEGYISAVEWALNNEDVDVIGLSILGCPIALGLEEKQYDAEYNDWYKMQRFVSRWKIFTVLEDRGLLTDKAINRFHCLGLVDGPNEIRLVERYHQYIRSWDSSSAIWLGLNGMSYDQSSTGIKKGKFEVEVDFDFKTDDDKLIKLALANAEYINQFCKG